MIVYAFFPAFYAMKAFNQGRAVAAFLPPVQATRIWKKAGGVIRNQGSGGVSVKNKFKIKKAYKSIGEG